MTSATNALAHDRSGVRYLIAGEMPGAVLHRETPTGWTTQPLFSDGRSQLLVSAATMIDERRGYTVFQHLDRNAVDMAITRDGCWSREELSASALWRAQLSLDAMDRPWSTYYRSGTGGWGLYLRGPEREVLLSRYDATISGSAEAPIVNALSSTADQRPTVAAMHADGSVHLHEPASGDTFSDRALPSPGPDVSEGACPTGRLGGPPGGGCMGQTMCTQRVASTLPPFAAVRTNDGSVWVARLYQDWTTDYRLREMCGGPGCVCSSEATAWRGFTELRLQRVRGTDVREALRLTLSRTRPIGVDRVAMQVRGTTLTMVLPAAGMNADGTSLRYLEVDTTLLR
jgi:hypothetical protein